MDIDLRKTATDAAYIVVGAGVLGFQQAQVRRRDARARLDRLRNDARGTAAAVGTQVRDQVNSQVGAAAGVASTVDPRAFLDPVVGDLKARVEPVVQQLRSVSLPTALPSSLTDAVQTLPAQVAEQVARAIEVGRTRVQGTRGPAATA
jgi:hypothetical protein